MCRGACAVDTCGGRKRTAVFVCDTLSQSAGTRATDACGTSTAYSSLVPTDSKRGWVANGAVRVRVGAGRMEHPHRACNPMHASECMQSIGVKGVHACGMSKLYGWHPEQFAHTWQLHLLKLLHNVCHRLPSCVYGG